MSTVGDKIPEKTVCVVPPSGETEEVALSSYRGRWFALIFYPRDFSFVCPTEVTAFSAKRREFEKRSCALLAASIDSVETHRAWLGTDQSDGGVSGLQFPLVADEDGSLCEAFGIWDKHHELPLRGLFLIDPEGVIQYAVVHGLSVGRQPDEILRVLDALQAGGLCPASWSKADGVLNVAELLNVGRVLGNYRIEETLGRGGFGVVLKAMDLRLRRAVAIKVLAETDLGSAENLLDEARAVAAVSHPNVCQVYSADEIDGLPTLVMEYVAGKSLDSELSGPLDADRVCFLAMSILAGLAATHERGIVHGDLKPANILLRDDAERSPVIVDFGIAAAHRGETAETSPAVAEVSDDDDATAQTVITESTHGVISGTPRYMSPEQAQGQSLTPASDIFSLGMVLIELMLGTHPLAERPLLETLGAIINESAIDRMVQQTPPVYHDVLASMLRCNPHDRPAAAALAERFETLYAKRP